ncbi:hypothetical protein F442_04481 [Phytophthora nicotianae P10297]|uniref:Uncharacterized protein n=1 Tax=Phytophthora nicotianae P10297 TaxID=1317064 RepID=W2ZSW6_PHYNI|nr:hypothetical protein F442_04481 [Phytophthora nicotianae P10297]
MLVHGQQEQLRAIGGGGGAMMEQPVAFMSVERWERGRLAYALGWRELSGPQADVKQRTRRCGSALENAAFSACGTRSDRRRTELLQRGHCGASPLCAHACMRRKIYLFVRYALVLGGVAMHHGLNRRTTIVLDGQPWWPLVDAAS